MLANLIVPGERIGHVRIGESSDSVVRDLGEPDSSDGAMGHVRMTWVGSDRVGQEPRRLDVSASFDGNGAYHLVRQIRVTSSRFATREAIAPGTDLDAMRAAFPTARPVARFIEGNADFVMYDDSVHGIAFEVRQGAAGLSDRCRAIIVHTPGRSVLDEDLSSRRYLSLRER
jgi:hypothetical protein